MNGGVYHAVQAVGELEVQAAAAGFEYFGLRAIAEVLRRVQNDPKLREWSDAPEDEQVLVGCFTRLSFNLEDVESSFQNRSNQRVRFTGKPARQQ